MGVVDEDWDDLTEEQKQAAKTLGYTKKKWDNDGDPTVDEDWDDLTDEQKKAAKTLGYNKASWDETGDDDEDEEKAKVKTSSNAKGSFKMGHTKMAESKEPKRQWKKGVSGPEVDKLEEQLDRDGFVVLPKVFSPDQIQNLTDSFEKLWSQVQKELKGKKPDEDDTYYLDDGEEVVNLGKNRWDFVRGLEKGIFAQKWFHDPPIVDELCRRKLKTNYTHYVGALPTGAHAGSGQWHRDTYSLFEDEAFDVSVPPYYITVLIPLVAMTESNGATEFIPGSHKKTKAQFEKDKVVYGKTQLGDVVLFNGLVWHRGGPNDSDNDRPVLYMVYHKNWYNDD